MTNEEHIEELLIESEFFGFRTEVLELSEKIIKENPKMDRFLSIETAFNYMKTKIQENNNDGGTK
jgi:hypothetical protein